jgi:peroxiredoxin
MKTMTTFPAVMQEFRDQTGTTLWDLTHTKPRLLVFLRHSGCAFCREALSDLRARRAEIETLGAGLAFVHMMNDADAAPFFNDYSLGDVPRFSDPDRALYGAFRLKRGSLAQLLGPKVWIRGMQASFLKGHGIGRPIGDPFQMPGAFLIAGDTVVKAYRHATAADQPDYVQMAAGCSISPGKRTAA